MECLAEYFTNYILKKEMINENDYEAYRYGFLTGMEMLLCCITSLIIAITFGSLIKLFVFIAVFFPLRAYSGGAHMKHYYACFICSNLVVVGALLIPSDLFAGTGMLMAEGLLLFLIHCMAYKAILYEDDAEKKYFSKMRKLTLVMVAILSGILLAFERIDLLTVVMYTVFVTFLSEGIQIVKCYGIQRKKK